MNIRTLALDIFRSFFISREFRIDFRIDFCNDCLKVNQKHNAVFHLDDTNHTGLVANFRSRLHILPRNTMNAGNIFNQKTDIVVIDFRHNNIARF